MIVRCLVNRGSDLPEYRFGLGYTAKTKFSVEVGKTYDVFAMSFFQKGLTVLIYDKYRYPTWCQIDLFEFVDDKIPADWRFARRDGGEYGAEAVLGYAELIDDERQLEGLSELELPALRAFGREYEKRTGVKMTHVGMEEI